MKEIIKKSKVYGDQVILLDDADYLMIQKCGYNICLHKSPKGMYVKVRNVITNNPRKKFFLHRVIMSVLDEDVFIDHNDGNGLNNQKQNLRKCSPSQNSMNRPKTALNSTGFKGVTKISKNRYGCQISAYGKKFFGGSFKTAEEAAKKYNELSHQYHGEFGYQNQL